MKKSRWCFIVFIAVLLNITTTSVFAKLNTDDVATDENTNGNQATITSNKNAETSDNDQNLATHSVKSGGVIYSDPQKPIVVKKNSPTFSVILHSNPSTGYSWALKSLDSEIIKPISKTYYAGKVGLIGAPGYEKWVFAVKPYGFIVPQTTSVTLIYARPWDLQGAQAINFKVVTVNVN